MYVKLFILQPQNPKTPKPQNTGTIAIIISLLKFKYVIRLIKDRLH